MKKNSATSVFGEMQINTMRHHYALPRMETKTITSIGNDVENLEPSHTARGNVKCCSHLEVTWKLLKMVTLRPITQKIHSYLGKVLTYVHPAHANADWSTVHNSENTWKLPKCTSNEGTEEQMWSTHVMETVQ